MQSIVRRERDRHKAKEDGDYAAAQARGCLCVIWLVIRSLVIAAIDVKAQAALACVMRCPTAASMSSLHRKSDR